MSDGSFTRACGLRRGHAAVPLGARPRPRPAGRSRTRIHHLRELKERGERWPMLTAYDMLHRRDLRRGRDPGAARRRLGRQQRLRLRQHPARDGRRAAAAGQGRGAGDEERARRRGPAVRQLPDRPRAGADDLLPVHEGGRGARRQAGGRGAVRPAGRGAGRVGHPGDGAPRVHPAERARARRVSGSRAAATPGSGSSRTRWRCRRPGRSRWCWRWCRPTSPSG